VVDELLKRPATDGFRSSLVQYLISGKSQDKMPMQLVAAQEAVMLALETGADAQ
jgi:hypothetical protein